MDQERDLSFYASRGLDIDFFELLETIREEYKKLDEKTRIKKEEKIVKHTLLTVSIESKNNSPQIAREIIDKADEKTLLSSILYCFRTKEINEEIQEILHVSPEKIINNSVEIDVEIAKKKVSKIISNSDTLIEMIALQAQEKALQKLPSENKKYLTKKLPQLDLKSPKEYIKSILDKSDNPEINIIKDHLEEYLEILFLDFSKKNTNNNIEIYFTKSTLVNDYMLKTEFLICTNREHKTIFLKMMLKNKEFVIFPFNNNGNRFQLQKFVTLEKIQESILEYVYKEL